MIKRNERRTTAAKAEDLRRDKQATHGVLKKGLFRSGHTHDTGGALGASGNGSSMLILSPAAERRQKAARAAEAAAAEERRAQAEAAAIAQRAVEARAQQQAEARKAAQVRKAAADEAARQAEVQQIILRAVWNQECKRQLVIRTNIRRGTLSTDAVAVFSLLVHQYRNAGNRAVYLPADTAAKALDIKPAVAREALEALVRQGWAIEAVDNFGTTRILPAAHAVASVEVEEAA